MNKPIDGYIGMDLTYCGECGLEADDCKCEAVVVDEVEEEQVDRTPGNERLKANRRARS